MNQRTNQLDRTRDAIIEAAKAYVFGEADPTTITMQAVADAAGVSHRTLYRHFESRQDLINAVGAQLDEELTDAVAADILDSFEKWTGQVDQVMTFGAMHREALRRGLIVGISGAEFRTDRDEAYWRIFRARFPHLDEAEARQDFVALRHVLGANNVILMGERFGMSPEELVPVIRRSVDTLVADIERRDTAAAEATS
ncbi:MAG: TetR/AcrR family transcriptional regulator [Acidimicrobiia bacterium]|nr:TetR/AcrR family transcriptional regulator [Acidimicrobiia bacterium]